MRNGVNGATSSRNVAASSGPNDCRLPGPDTPPFVKASTPSNARSQPVSRFGSAGVTTAAGSSFTYARPIAGTGTFSSTPELNVAPSFPASVTVPPLDEVGDAGAFGPAESLHAAATKIEEAESK